MLIKLIRPLLENSWKSVKLIPRENLSTSSALFQQSVSGKNSGASPEMTNPAFYSKDQQENNENESESDNEQERSQQEGPADKEAERTASIDD